MNRLVWICAVFMAFSERLPADTLQYQQGAPHQLTIEYNVDIEQPLPGDPLVSHVKGEIDAVISARVTSDSATFSSSLPDEVTIIIDQWSGLSAVNGESRVFGSLPPKNPGLRYVPSAAVRCGEAIKGRALTFRVDRDVKVPSVLTIQTAPELLQLYREYPTLKLLLPPSFFVTVLEQILALGGLEIDSGWNRPLQVTITDGLSVPATFVVEQKGNRFCANVIADINDAKIELPSGSVSEGAAQSVTAAVSGELHGTCEWDRSDALVAHVEMEATYGTHIEGAPGSGNLQVSSRWIVDSVASDAPSSRKVMAR
ncbi:hypothetical protein SCG7086_AE_00070 [Chlamydiales bacterium SCGC AG-110-P3]|nr:hypothetical protein SCG7086_AE_00070 [Chlamydiales bacterium SCGC AG-110-P3]